MPSNLPRHLSRDLTKILSNKLVQLTLVLFFVFLIIPFLFAIALDVKPSQDITYGANFSPEYAQFLTGDWKKVYLALLDDLKVNNLRLVAYWSKIEKERGIYDFSELDWQLTEAKKRNVSVVLALGRKVPRWPECHLPKWAKKLSDQEQEKRLLELLKVEVEHFKNYDNIKIWQVENEPYFPFGECDFPRWEFVRSEVNLVRLLDSRPIIVQDSGEGGFWLPTYKLGDYLGISMYRRIWYDFWGVIFGKHIFFTYPLSHWSYPLKARILGIPLDKVVVLELQAEPWGDGAVNELTLDVKDRTMSKDKFFETMSYAQKTGIGAFYFWGAEWWYWEKEFNNEPFFWNASKAFWK
ncbi:MAG: hypothetical protein AAB443_01280 [Patescibacteria group bacterium]